MVFILTNEQAERIDRETLTTLQEYVTPALEAKDYRRVIDLLARAQNAAASLWWRETNRALEPSDFETPTGHLP